MRKSPCVPVVVVRSMVAWGLVSTTVAPGIALPLGSVIVPCRELVDPWGKTSELQKKRTASSDTENRDGFMAPPIPGMCSSSSPRPSAKSGRPGGECEQGYSGSDPQTCLGVTRAPKSWKAWRLRKAAESATWGRGHGYEPCSVGDSYTEGKLPHLGAWEIFAIASAPAFNPSARRCAWRYDFMFRKYNAAHGRWMSPDPAGISVADPSSPQSWNRIRSLMTPRIDLKSPLESHILTMVTAIE